MSDADRLKAAFGAFVDSLADAEESVRGMSTFTGPDEPSRGYQHLLRSVMKSIERELVHDPLRPRFRVLDDRVRTGGDNPDQRYWFAHVEPGARYRLRGRKGSARRLEVQLFSREPYGAEDVSVGYLTDERIEFGDDGRFVVELGPHVEIRRGLDSSEAAIVQVREIYDSWDHTQPSELSIELLDAPGPPRPKSADDLVAMLERAAFDLTRSAQAWPALIADRVLAHVEPNTLPPLRNPGASAGVEGRWMSIGPYLVAEGDAVVISVLGDGADYVGVQLADLWMASLEYADACSSRTRAQSLRAPDGRTYHVISLTDPGYLNWLDPVGVNHGIVHVRLDGLPTAPSVEHQPDVFVTPIASLPVVIPGFDEGRITADERRRELADRRQHVQLRYGR